MNASTCNEGFTSNKGIDTWQPLESTEGRPGEAAQPKAKGGAKGERLVSFRRHKPRPASHLTYREELLSSTAIAEGTPAPEALQQRFSSSMGYPNQAVAYLRASVPGQPGYQIGTGFFIGPYVLVTAAHVLFPRAQGAGSFGSWVAQIEVIAGLSDFDTPPPFGIIQTRHFACSPIWRDLSIPATLPLDYGFVLLDQPLGAKTGYFGFANLADMELQGAEVKFCGYPCRDPGTQQLNAAQWGCSGTLDQPDPDQLYYGFDTIAGQSGGPLFIFTPNSARAVGIHTTVLAQDDMGVRINSSVYANLQHWASFHPAAAP